MSSGKIVIKNRTRRENSMEQSIADIIYQIVPAFEVEVEDADWKIADKKIEDNVAKLDNKHVSDVEILNQKIKEIEKRIGANQGNLSDDIKSIKTEIENLKTRKPLDLTVRINDSKPKDLGKQHYQLPVLLQILATKLNVYIVGPAGAGKTYAAIQCAKALGVEFYFTGAVASEFKLTGFIDAQGRIVSTEFRKAFENGGLFLFDEIDASYPQAVLAFNAALANDYMDFPDKRVQRHKDFYCIAAANTYGQGADRQYVGRNQLDAASLDRFVFLDWEYDENLERELAGNEDWSDYVQKVRRLVVSLKIRHVVSPRASIYGARLLASGLNREIVEQTILWKGLDNASRNKVIEYMTPQQIYATRIGEFIPKVKKGDRLKQNDVIGTIVYKYSWETRREDVVAPFECTIAFISKNRDINSIENKNFASIAKIVHYVD
jgi:cobaltochelatase CobS